MKIRTDASTIPPPQACNAYTHPHPPGDLGEARARPATETATCAACGGGHCLIDGHYVPTTGILTTSPKDGARSRVFHSSLRG